MAIGHGHDAAFFLLRGSCGAKPAGRRGGRRCRHAVRLAPDDIGVQARALGLKVRSLIELGDRRRR